MSNKRVYDDLDDELLNLANPKKKPKATGEVPEKEEYTESDFDDGFDDDLMGDEEDRAYLMSLTELERESIIYDRAEAREKLRAAREKAIREGKLKVKTEIETTKSKRGRSSSSSQSSHRDVLSDIGQKRKQRRENDLKREKEAMEQHARAAKMMEEEEEKKKVEQKKEEEEPESDLKLEHIRALHITRKMLAKWHNEYIFEKIIMNGFVRVFVGFDKGQRVYRLAQVAGVKLKNRKYQFENTETKKYLVLKIGKSIRTWAMKYCSNSSITQAEFDKWVQQMKKVNEKLPTAHDTVQWVKERDKAISEFKFDEQSITLRLKEKELAGIKIKKNLAAEKTELQLKLELLLNAEEKNEEEIENCRRRIEEIDKQLEEDMKQLKQSLGVPAINKKNRPQNRVSPPRFIKPADIPKRKVEKLDPFARRTTREFNWFSASSPDSSTPKTPQEKEDSKVSQSPNKSPGINLHEAHNIELNIDLGSLDEPSEQKPKPIIVKQQQSTPQPKVEDSIPRKTLSVDDYKRRRGLL